MCKVKLPCTFHAAMSQPQTRARQAMAQTHIISSISEDEAQAVVGAAGDEGRGTVQHSMLQEDHRLAGPGTPYVSANIVRHACNISGQSSPQTGSTLQR